MTKGLGTDQTTTEERVRNTRLVGNVESVPRHPGTDVHHPDRPPMYTLMHIGYMMYLYIHVVVVVVFVL
jgi:hypothetical protein